MYRLLRALLFLFPAETAHHLGIFALRCLSAFPSLCRWWRGQSLDPALAVDVAGMRFPHPVCLAAGFDKDARVIPGLFALGFGAVEVGTVTPRPQPGNPKPRMFRLKPDRALINRLGFNNRGADEAADRLALVAWRPAPIGINVGKNKDTPVEQAAGDYVRCVQQLAPLADYVVVNASSPNTPGLRKLQEPDQLRALLRAVKARIASAAPGKPLFLKIAPDLVPEAVDAVVDVALTSGVDALICTNTTIERPLQHPLAAESGGLSGAPLSKMSTDVIRRAYARSKGQLPIIGVGGVFTARDVLEKMRAGASVVQAYTAFVYEGPGWVRRVLKELRHLMQAQGIQSIREIVGADHRVASTHVADR